MKKCPFSLCDGTGFITFKEPYYHREACKCMLEELEEQAKKDRLVMRFKFANIPEEFKGIKVNDFNINAYTSEKDRLLAENAKHLTVNYVLNFEELKKSGKGLYYHSNTKGSGKTMLVLALANALISKCNVRVKFLTTVDLFSEIKKTYSKQTEYCESELLECLKEVDVLILDDIGTEKQSSWINEILYQIFNSRMSSTKVTILTSNVNIEQLQHDDRIKNRIEKMCFPIAMPEESVRTKIAQRENDEILTMLLA